MALSLYCFFNKSFFSVILLQYYSEQILYQICCIMFVWKIKLYSCVVRLLSYWLHGWSLIFQHKVHDVFRNPSWYHTFHFDVNFSLLSFVLRLHFAINVLTLIPLLRVAVYIRSLLGWIPKILWRNHCHMHARECELFTPKIGWSLNNGFVKWWDSHEEFVFILKERNA